MGALQIDTLKHHIHTLMLLTKKVGKMLMQSKTGLVGLAIILAFAFMAVFAPFLAPYDPDFIAPPEDIFTVNKVVHNFTLKEGYHPIQTGPTTPSSESGGIWFIMAHPNGTIHMDFAKNSEGDPFEEGNLSIALNIADYGLEPPLSEVKYLAQGLTKDQAWGDARSSGLLAFAANTTFVILDPFRATNPVLYSQDVGFVPRWVVQDTVSAGEMYNPPIQQSLVNPNNIWDSIVFGPYRYVTLANDTGFVTYKFEYCWNTLGISDMHVLAGMNVTVAQRPLNYLFDHVNYSARTTGVYIPSANGTLLYFNETSNGTAARVAQFNISGEPAVFTGEIGFYRSADSTPVLYIPTGTPDYSYSVKIYDPHADTILGEFQGSNGIVRIAPTAKNILQGEIYASIDTYENGAATESAIYRFGNNGLHVTPYVGRLDTVAANMFIAGEMAYAIDERGVVYSAETVISLHTPYLNTTMKEMFYTGSSDSDLEYLGSFAGTKHTTTGTSIELYILYFDPEIATAVIFQAIGTNLGALPPGTYPSGNTYYLGTDNVGHDILTLLIYGSRIALFVGLTAAFFSVVVGTLIGLISGYYGGKVDIVLMRITDIALTIPFLPIVLIWTQISGQSIWNIVIILALLGWPGITRVVRAQTLSLKERSFVDAARVSGSSDSKIILKHIAPNVLPFSFLYMTLFVAGAILTEAALSYLALGDPKVVSWGNMLSTIQTSGHSLIAPWWMLPPGLAITTLSLGFYLLGRGMDEIINPRLRRR